MINYWHDYPEIENELLKVHQLMKNTVKNPNPFISEPIDNLINHQGKMLRSGLAITSAMFGDYQQEKVQPIAAVLELLHAATLIHDDIIDHSKLRRGTETIQSKYGTDVAVYAGDYILTKCFSLISKEHDQSHFLRINTKLSKVCEGELKQYVNRYNSNLSISEYLKIVTSKTASFFGLAMYIGASLGNFDDATCRLFALAGIRLGTAFQIIDDCLDYTGNELIINKNAQNDLKSGLYTLPLIIALKDAPDDKLKNLIDATVFSDDDIEKIQKLVVEYKGVEKAQKYAQRYSKKSLSTIKRLPPSAYASVLEGLIKTLIERTY